MFLLKTQLQQRCSVLLVLFFAATNLSQGLKLNSNGGYDLTVAIDLNAQPKGSSYIASVEAVFSTLSSRLFLASRGTFFIQSVAIVVPPTWTSEDEEDPVEADAIAGHESFGTSDIRISDDYVAPYVENPNICGHPGQFIQFPTDFFSRRNDGEYGEAWKALLTQWARFRWGVWEEHGIPGNDRFPYFHKESPKSSSWTTTGCSNVEILGKVLDKFGDAHTCDLADEEMADDCRFIPSHDNSATSSLMHFHFMESVTNFCDETTHVRTSPNKQNLFCGHKSVWEVIRQTPDYGAVTNPISGNFIPPVQFKTISLNEGPVLYVLMDKGQPDIPSVVTKLNRNLAELFESPAVLSTLASLGTFPSKTSGGSYVEEQVGWTTVSANKDAFIRAVQADPGIGAPTNRDFGLAILEAVKNIKQMSPPGGAVLLVVKVGAGRNSFGNLSFEEDVQAELLNSPIKLVVAELEVGKTAPYVNLVSLTERAGGHHVLVTGSNIDSPIIQDLIAYIGTILGDPILPNGNSILIYKGPVAPFSIVPIYLRPHLTSIRFTLTVPDSANIAFVLEEGAVEEVRAEWDETVDPGKRKVLAGNLAISDAIVDGKIWNFEYFCRGGCDSIVGQVVISGTYKNVVDPDMEIVGISAYTSAVENVADMNATKASDTPFSVFARVSLKGVPVTNLIVESHLGQPGVQESWNLAMVDDGLGSPDLVKGDGIYSATFIPPADGSYHVSVTVINDQVRPVPPTVRLLPIDQNQLIGCATGDCQPTSLSKLFETSVDLPAPVTFINRALFLSGKPSRINDLQIFFEDSPTTGIRLQFTSPKLVDADSVSGVKYTVFISPTMGALLGDLTDPDLQSFTQDAGAPGTSEDFLARFAFRTDLIYVGVQTVNQNQKGDISNIQSVQVEPYTGPTTTDESTSSMDPDTTTTDDDGASTMPTNPTSPPTIDTTIPPRTTNPTNPPPTTNPTIPPITDPSATPPPTDSTNPPPTTGNPTNQPPTQPPGPWPSTAAPENDKPFFETTWGIVVIVAIVLVVLAAGGGIAFYCVRRNRGCYSTKKPVNSPDVGNLPSSPSSPVRPQSLIQNA